MDTALDGRSPRLVYAEDQRHVYGGHVSPDSKYVQFTGNMKEDGDPGHNGAPMALMRPADSPIIGGETAAILSSFSSTCRPHSIDPQIYFTQLLTNLPSTSISRLDHWLPDQWKPAKPGM